MLKRTIWGTNMAYDLNLAARIREALGTEAGVSERKMFGGLCFMVCGHMCCGVVEDRLMLRVGKDQYRDALQQPHAREMDFTGRPMTGMIYVAAKGLEGKQLDDWLQWSLRFVASLPPK